jgi:dUTP pyrophosphatase
MDVSDQATPSPERSQLRHQLLATRTDSRGGPPFPATPFPNDCGLDLAVTQSVSIWPGQTVNADCGIAVALPPATFGLITARSSTWQRWGLMVIPGIIDEGWRGELRTVLYRPHSDNLAMYGQPIEVISEPLVIPGGSRLAQFIVLPSLLSGLEIVHVPSLPASARGERGYGSSGV